MDEITRFSLEGDNNPANRARTATEVAILQEHENRQFMERAQKAIEQIMARGAAAERARARQLALAHAERWLADGSEFAAQALRELADELEDR